MASRTAPQRLRIGTARERAADVLVRVETEAAFAAAALDAALDRAPPLNDADRGLLTELVYGVLRTAPALDVALARHATREGSLAKLDPYTRTVLRIAAYQILALARIPVRAAVNEAVGALKRDRSPGLAGFANALLRKLATERAEPMADDARDHLALASVPREVESAIATCLGSPDDARSVLRAMFTAVPGTSVRTNTTRITRDELATRLAAERSHAIVERGSLSPLALRIRGAGDLADGASYREGLFAIQEEGAQAIALAARAEPGMRILDACAGRGGKTSALAAAMRSEGVLHAIEMYPEKVVRIADELDRLGLRRASFSFATAAADLTRGFGALTSAVPSDGYDVVLLDAPCSGLGTLARRPDILARAPGRVMVHDESDDLPARGSHRVPLPDLQRQLLDAVAPRVRRGGTLLYAVCTLTREEGDAQIEAFRARHPDFAPCDADGSLPDVLRPSRIVLRPDQHGTDGFVAFRLRRRES
jgi:16S rRNA (cytosine967-C5)-methyltransferase